MKKKPTPPVLIVDNDKILLIEVASEYEMLGKAIKRDQITSGPDSPRVIELKELQSTALKRVLGKLVQATGKPGSRSRAKLKLLDPQIDE
jgi:hypothetical protein